MMKEFHRRTLAKTVSWRVLATLTTIDLVFAFTGRVDLSLGVGTVEIVAKMLLYYGHERVWDRMAWGRMHHPLQGLPVSRPLTPEDMQQIRHRLHELGYM